jgi:hypothetical protein
MGKKYHPARLPGNAHGDLLRVCMQMYQFLSGRMVTEEKALAERDELERAAREGPKLSLKDPQGYLKLSPSTGRRVNALVSVTHDTYEIFTLHKLVNIQSSGAFFPIARGPDLGTPLDVTLQFFGPQKEIKAAAKVVVDCRVDDGRHLVGFGIQLEKLPEAERGFLNEFVGTQRRTRR